MASNGTVSTLNPTCMESVNRVSKLPIVESTIQTATNVYGKVKDYNTVTHWTLSTAESTVNKAVEVSKPIVTPVMNKLEEPIKKVDTILCSSLDYVENKVPAVKLPPNELITQIYNSTKDYLTPAIECAKIYAEPAYNTAKDMLEPAVDKAHAIKDNVMHKVDELLHKGHECAVGESCSHDGLNKKQEEDEVEEDRQY